MSDSNTVESSIGNLLHLEKFPQRYKPKYKRPVFWKYKVLDGF